MCKEIEKMLLESSQETAVKIAIHMRRCEFFSVNSDLL